MGCAKSKSPSSSSLKPLVVSAHSDFPKSRISAGDARDTPGLKKVGSKDIQALFTLRD